MLRRWFGFIRWYLDAARLLSVVLLGSDAEDAHRRGDPR